MANTNLSLEQVLQKYRVLNAPTRFSWKQHWANEVFSSDDLLECSPSEQEQFSKRLKECPITISSTVRATGATGCTVCTLVDLVKTIISEDNKNTDKQNRKVVYSTAEGVRPTNSMAYNIWNGFQAIDMDIKNHDIAVVLKTVIFKKLSKCNWFLGVALSSSGKGLHVYTKIAVPQLEENDLKKQKMLFTANFRHKYSFVYLACASAIEELNITKEQIISWLDLAMFKPQQPLFITYDPHPLINTRFFEEFIYVNFDNVEDLGSPEIDWVTYPDLVEVFKRWEWFEEEPESQIQIDVLDNPEIDITKIRNKVHYKHFERWRLANTLVNLYGKEKGYAYMRMVCSNNITDRELQADCETAARYKKPVDVWAVNRLNNQHGFSIKLDIQGEDVQENDLYVSMDRIKNPTMIHESSYVTNFHLTKNQYLSDIQEDLLSNLGRITLIEAGAGVGKTEMVKQMVRSGLKVVMVMPFTSTIKSKVENDPDWYYSYGSRKPRLDVSGGLSLTIDKFARLNLMDIKAAGFDYIFIDESHLLFQSEYRPVMSKVIEKICNTEIPIVLMSGTPSGETVFFPDIVHLKVVKDDTRKKEFNVNLVENTSDLMFHMCRNMAKDIMDGKRILFPTNSGTLYSKQIKAAVTFFMQHDYQNFEEVKLKYYKKSNIGEDFMDGVNFDKTVNDTQILLCTDYLSVGVDILDRYNFSIYFADLMMPQEVEQFANRLRNNDLFINLYIAKNDSDGNSRFINKYKEMNLRFNEDELRAGKAVVKICNEQIQRNPTQYKYNVLVNSFTGGNKFIEYNEIENKYYLNEVAYKVTYFERKYRDYVQQLPVLMKGMKSYGYDVTSTDLKNPNEDGAEIFKNLKDMVKLAYDEQINFNTSSIEELMDYITEQNIGEYREALANNFDIRKGDEWKIDGNAQKVTAKNIEMYEKVVPIFLSMYKTFTIDDIKDIFDSCRNKNMSFNFAAIGRVRMLANIIYSNKRNRLDLPIQKFMEESYDFADLGIVDKTQLDDFINDFAERYAAQCSDDIIKVNMAELTMKSMKENLLKIFKCLVNVSRPQKDGTITMERVELLWKEKEKYNEGNPNDKLFILADFLGLSDKN